MVKSVVTQIEARKKVSVEIEKIWYTAEYCETRSIPADANIDEEKQDLWDSVNEEVNLQISELYGDDLEDAECES